MKIDFGGLIRMYHAQALIYLGKVKNPVTDKYEQNIAQAELLIDILSILKDKTAGNLSSEEQVMIEQSTEKLKTEYSKINN